MTIRQHAQTAIDSVAKRPDLSSTISPPAPSRASRKPSLHSKGSHRGSLLGPQGFTFLYESDLEAKIALVMSTTRPEVVDVLDQPPAIIYRDDAGALRSHTFDQRIDLADGRRILVAIKPRAKAEERNLLRTVEAIAKQIPKHVATHVMLMDERHCPRETVRDAKLFHAVGRDPASPADDAMRRLTSTLNGATTVAALIEASGLGAQAFRSIVRLVANGTLRKLDRAALGYESRIAPTASSVLGEAA